ncbi:hypothetical protein RhiJN_12202 [Ceratobasidium sp. AG-Ba]|nr:hypothetical protein RhiJN_12202 [Ceratobasidium sp. AG-Ba]
MSSTTSLSASPTATSGGGSSAASRTPNIGAIVGGALGGIVLLVVRWSDVFCPPEQLFPTTGYRRAQEERMMFEKRPRPVSGVSQTSGFGNRPPGPDGGGNEDVWGSAQVDV